MSAEHELYTASVVYPEVCCLYTGHSGLDVQTYYRIPSLFLSSSVVQSPPCTNTPEDYFAVDSLSRNNMVYSKPLSGDTLYVACKQFITKHYSTSHSNHTGPQVTAQEKCSSWTVWTNYNPLTHQEPLAQWHGITAKRLTSSRDITKPQDLCSWKLFIYSMTKTLVKSRQCTISEYCNFLSFQLWKNKTLKKIKTNNSHWEKQEKKNVVLISTAS